MRLTPLMAGMFLAVSLIFVSEAYAVNEHNEAQEAADRALILKREKQGATVDSEELNVPDLRHNSVNSAGSHTMAEPTNGSRDSRFTPEKGQR